MKTATVVRKYYKKRTKDLRLILNKPKEDISAKDFHKLRLNIKKMRALIQLVQFSSQKFKRKKYSKVYKKLFKQSGRVRDIQIEIAVVDRTGINGSLKSYRNALKNQKGKEKRKWFLLANKNEEKKFRSNYKSLKPYFKIIDKDKVNNFLAKKGHNAKRLIKKKVKRKRLHALRKKIKIIYYILVLFGKKKRLRETIKKVQNLLGEWHDCAVMSRHLQNVLDKEELRSNEKLAIKALKEKITDKRKRLFSEIKKSKTLSAQLTEFL